MTRTNHGSDGQSFIRRWHITCPANEFGAKNIVRDGHNYATCELIVDDPAYDPVSLGTFPTRVDECTGDPIIDGYPVTTIFMEKMLSRWTFIDASENGQRQEPCTGLQLQVGIDYGNRADPHATLSPHIDPFPCHALALMRGYPETNSSHKPEYKCAGTGPHPFPIYCPDDESAVSVGAAACALLTLYFESYMPMNVDWPNIRSLLKPDDGTYALSWSGNLDFIVQKVQQQSAINNLHKILVVMFSDDSWTLDELDNVHMRLNDVVQRDTQLDITVRHRRANLNGTKLPYATLFMSFVE